MAKAQITKFKEENITWNRTNYELDGEPSQDHEFLTLKSVFSDPKKIQTSASETS